MLYYAAVNIPIFDHKLDYFTHKPFRHLKRKRSFGDSYFQSSKVDH